MKQHEATDSVRIDKQLFSKIKEIAKSKRQSYAGYIELHLQKPVERDWKKLQEKQNGLQ